MKEKTLLKWKFFSAHQTQAPHILLQVASVFLYFFVIVNLLENSLSKLTNGSSCAGVSFTHDGLPQVSTVHHYKPGHSRSPHSIVSYSVRPCTDINHNFFPPSTVPRYTAPATISKTNGSAEVSGSIRPKLVSNKLEPSITPQKAVTTQNRLGKRNVIDIIDLTSDDINEEQNKTIIRFSSIDCKKSTVHQKILFDSCPVPLPDLLIPLAQNVSMDDEETIERIIQKESSVKPPPVIKKESELSFSGDSTASPAIKVTSEAVRIASNNPVVDTKRDSRHVSERYRYRSKQELPLKESQQNLKYSPTIDTKISKTSSNKLTLEPYLQKSKLPLTETQQNLKCSLSSKTKIFSKGSRNELTLESLFKKSKSSVLEIKETSTKQLPLTENNKAIHKKSNAQSGKSTNLKRPWDYNFRKLMQNKDNVVRKKAAASIVEPIKKSTLVKNHVLEIDKEFQKSGQKCNLNKRDEKTLTTDTSDQKTTPIDKQKKAMEKIFKIKRKKTKKQKNHKTYCAENTVERSTENEDSIKSKKKAQSLGRYKNKDVGKNSVQIEKNNDFPFVKLGEKNIKASRPNQLTRKHSATASYRKDNLVTSRISLTKLSKHQAVTRSDSTGTSVLSPPLSPTDVVGSEEDDFQYNFFKGINVFYCMN